MSTINVNAGDTPTQLQTKVQSAKAGDTVLFSGNAKFNSPGYVQIAKGVKLRCAVDPIDTPWRTAQLDPKNEDKTTTETLQRLMCSTTISAPNGQYSFTVADGGELDIEGLGFDGSAIEMKGKSKITGRKCVIENFSRGPNNGFGSGVGIGHPTAWQAQESVLSEFSWRKGNGRDYDYSKGLTYDAPGKEQPKPDGWALGAFRYDGLTVIDSEVVDCANGFKSNNGGSVAYRGKFIRVYMSGISRMNDEMQGQVDGFELTDCFVENPVMSKDYNKDLDKLEWSEIYHGDKTKNVTARGNTYVSRERADGTGPRMFRETGNNAICEDNLIIGAGTCFPVFMGDSSGPRDEASIGQTYIRNNCVIDAKNGAGYSYGQYPQNAHFENNGPTVKLTWDWKRGRPGPGRKFKDGSTDPTDPAMLTLTGSPIIPTVRSPDLMVKGGRSTMNVLGITNAVKFLRFEPQATQSGQGVPDAGFVFDFAVPSGTGNSIVVITEGGRPAWDEKYRVIPLDADKKTLDKVGASAFVHIGVMEGVVGVDSGLLFPQTSTDPDTIKPFTRRAVAATPMQIGLALVVAKIQYDVTVNADKTITMKVATE